MAVATMVFGQVETKPIYTLDAPVFLDQRTDWFGYTSSEYYTTYAEGDIYFVTLISNPDVNYDWRILYGPVALMAVEDIAAAGLTYPFLLCFDISYESAYGYDGFDPVLVNNLIALQ